MTGRPTKAVLLLSVFHYHFGVVRYFVQMNTFLIKLHFKHGVIVIRIIFFTVHVPDASLLLPKLSQAMADKSEQHR